MYGRYGNAKYAIRTSTTSVMAPFLRCKTTESFQVERRCKWKTELVLSNGSAGHKYANILYGEKKTTENKHLPEDSQSSVFLY